LNVWSQKQAKLMNSRNRTLLGITYRASFVEYSDQAELNAKANHSDHELHGAVNTHDPLRGFFTARDYRAGGITINGIVVFLEMPFGAFDESGLNDCAIEGLQTYLEPKPGYFS